MTSDNWSNSAGSDPFNPRPSISLQGKGISHPTKKRKEEEKKKEEKKKKKKKSGLTN